MKLNFSALSSELIKQTEEVIAQLGIVASQDGLVLTAEKGKTLVVESDGKNIKITYPALNQYFRALTIVARNGEKEYRIIETAKASELSLMLDCSRNAVKTVAHLKEFIRNLALMGYNQIQLYTEDTFEIENEPFFGYMRGKYSVAELKEIDDYAYSFGVEVVPCIQTLAHLNCIFRWQEYQKICDIADILLIDDERTERLIDNMFRVLSSAYRSRKIHIGMDEANLVGRGKYQDRYGFVENKSELIVKHLNKVVSIAEKYGYQPMMWSDMFFRLAFDGEYYTDKDEVLISEEVMKKVPKNLRLVYWDYVHEKSEEYAKMINAHLAFNREVMFAGGAWTWKGFAPINSFSLTCTKPALDACFEKGLDKIMLTMWGDNGAECSFFGVLPTLCYMAERVYGHEDCEEMFKALTGIAYEDFLALDMPNQIYDSATCEYMNPCKYGLFADPMGSWLDFVLVNGVDEKYAAYAKRLGEIEKTAGKFAYLFATQRALCEVLQFKSDLGLRVREAYGKGDKAALKKLVEERFYPSIKRIDEFYKVFKAQWKKENKPQGFEVQDYRLGGLAKRMEHDIEVILEYVNGDVDKIEQLEEQLLEPIASKPRIGDIHSFTDYVTCCIF